MRYRRSIVTSFCSGDLVMAGNHCECYRLNGMVQEAVREGSSAVEDSKCGMVHSASVNERGGAST